MEEGGYDRRSVPEPHPGCKQRKVSRNPVRDAKQRKASRNPIRDANNADEGGSKCIESIQKYRIFPWGMLHYSARLKVGKKEERFFAPQTHPERPDRIVGVNAKRTALVPKDRPGCKQRSPEGSSGMPQQEP